MVRGLPGLLAAIGTVLVVAACAAPARPPTSNAPAAPPAASSAAPPAASGAPAATGAAPSAAAPAAAPARAAAPAPLNPPVTVKVASLAGLTDAGLFVAMDRGYFTEEGLEIEATRVDGAAQAMPHVATGQLDAAGVTPAAAFYNAVNRGLALKIAADKGRVRGNQGQTQWVVREDLAASGNIREWADLRGLVLGINVPNSGSVTDIMLDRSLELGGLTRDDVRIVELPYPDMNPALTNRTIDAALANDPFVTQGINLGILRRFRSIGEATPDQYTGVWLFSPQFVTTEAAYRFVVGYLRGVRDYTDGIMYGKNKEGVVEALTKHTPIKDPALYAQMNFSFLDPDGRVSRERLLADQEYYLSRGYQQQPVDLDQVLDSRFVDAALARLGPYQPPTGQ